VLPEYFCLMGARDTDKLAVRETFAGAGRCRTSWPTRRASSACGSWAARCRSRARTMPHVRNTRWPSRREGECVARYDKIHLFRFDNGRERYDERRVIEPGTEPACFELPSRDGHAGASACRSATTCAFPSCTARARQGADLLLVPSAFTRTTARRTGSCCCAPAPSRTWPIVVAPAQGGTHENGRRTWGHSLVVDPWGTVVAEQASGEGVVLFDIDARQIERTRTQLPVLSHCVL
jgi:predicted amidohydrolase